MIEKKWLGDKTGQGFYKRVGKEKEIHAIDLKTLEYHPAAKVKFPAAEAARGIEDLGERLRALVKGDDRVGTFLWKLYSDLFLYSAEMVPEISDRIVEIDRAMRWGYAHKLGPFELWDALGFEDVCERLESEKREIPANIQKTAQGGAKSLYRFADSGGQPGTEYFDLGAREISASWKTQPGMLVLADIKRARGVVKQNAGASLIDLGDGVAVRRISQQDELDGRRPDRHAVRGTRRDREEFRGDGDRQSGREFQRRREPDAGAAGRAGRRMGRAESRAIHRFQQVNMALKYAREAGGGGAVRAIAGRRLRNSAALRAGAGVGGNLHGIGRGRRRADSGGRRMQGNAAAVGRSAASVRVDRHGEGFVQRRRRAGVRIPESSAIIFR